MNDSLERPREAEPPSFGRGLVFRIGFVYWALFCLIIVLGNISPLDEAIDPAAQVVWRAFAWIGNHVLGIEGELVTTMTGSGDRTVDWIWLGCLAITALVGGVAWALLDRRRAHDAQLREGLRIAMRYALGFSMLGYGFSKLFVVQFPSPSPRELMERFGDASPMGLLWTFMGASPVYVVLSGAAETLGALCLLFRRTALLGALVLVGVMANVVMLNFCYDVCVKIFSAHYLAMAIYLVLPDFGRLANVAYLNRVAQPRIAHLALSARWQRVRRIVKYGAIVTLLIALTVRCYQYHRQLHPEVPVPTWYDGYWDVASFHRDGAEVPASRSEHGRWQRLRFQQVDGKTVARWRTFDADPSGPLYRVVVDEHAQRFTLTPDADSAGPAVTLSYRRLDADRITLDGTVGGAHLAVQLERTPAPTTLTTRGFHWINDVPYNR